MHKILFRFFFVYFLLSTAIWSWFYAIPGVNYIIEGYGHVNEWIVVFFNKHLLHMKETLNMYGGGSGDTSFAWAEFYSHLILAALIALIWTLLDRKADRYPKLEYGLVTLLRYYVAIIAFSYGIIKLFALQMPFPSLSQLATPLGDFLPMRLSWMFIGYSTPYQVFSGVAEVLVGVLLLYRRTASLGALVGIGVFTNVFVLNLSYDIPVKLFSMQVLICCIYLVARDYRRVINFFLLNKSADASSIYDLELKKRWHKIARIVLKVGLILLFVVLEFINSWEWYQDERNKADLKPIRSGVYEITHFIKNNDTIPLLVNDEWAWKDFIFDKGGIGSINTVDTLLRQRYHRGYFSYKPDSVSQTIAFKKSMADSISLFDLKYHITSDTTLQLWGIVRSDSVHFNLTRSKRHFQLAERQFHWISEANR